METIMTTKTYTKTVTENVFEYKAFDGTIFGNPRECREHEDALIMKKLDEITVCHGLDGVRPFDGNEYSCNSDYTWYYPKSIDEIEALKEVFSDADFTDDDINHWICVESGDGYAFSVSLDECINQAKYILNKLGYEMTVSPKTNT